MPRRTGRGYSPAGAYLFARDGVGHVSISAIAQAAGVGKGTVFRRFGSKAGLAAALLGSQESELQEAVLFGPAPLGPGDPADPPPAARARLLAFFESYLRLLRANLELVHMSETASPGARYEVGSYRLWHRHVAILLTRCAPGLDADRAAHLLLAMVSSDLQVALGRVGTDTDLTDRTVLALLASAIPE